MVLDIAKGKVSVIIPCYNYGRFLGWCLNSVFNQTYTNYEVIVVDDGSTDQTRDVICNFRSRIKSVVNKQNCGCGVARNQGLKLAKGDLCLFLDADDYLEPFYLEKAVPALLNSGAGVVYCSFYKIFPNRERCLFLTKPYKREELLKQNFMAITSLTRTELVKKVGGFDNRILIQDYDLWLRITHIAQAVGILEPLFYQLLHGDNTSLNMKSRMLKEMERVRRRAKFGFFLSNNETIYFVSNVQSKHKIPKKLMVNIGFDETDVLTVGRDILNQYVEGVPVSSERVLFQVACQNSIY